MRLKHLYAATFATAMCALNPVAAQSLSPEAQYQQDLLRCEQEQAVVELQACKKEAAAALQASRNHTLSNGAATDYSANERGRCMALPVGQREDCLLLLSGQNTQVKGSISQGGVLRETTITIPAPAPASSVAPMPPAGPETAVPSPIRP